ncbi:MAG: RDD family protein [Nonlabens sp.]|uniref:RDD family protein n=1 Tax=Nonlabens sp. TaxID=1888209 RepID=UPI003EF8E97E
MNSLTDLEILNIITDDKESHSLQEIEQAQRIAEQRGLDVYLYVNDRDAYHRLSKIEKIVDHRASNKLRFINYLFDSFIIVLLLILIELALESFGSLSIERNWNNYKKFWIGLLMFAYYVIQEAIWDKTLGKIITGTIVVSEKNEKPDLSEILMRTACRFIPLEALSYLFMKDGFHDIFSKTKVIEEKTNI